MSTIKILTPKNITYPAKAVSDQSYDYIQCLPEEAEGFAIVRYVPNENEEVYCEFYADETELFLRKPVKLQVNSVSIAHVDIFAKKSSAGNWLQVGRAVPIVTGEVSFTLLHGDFEDGDFIDFKVIDSGGSGVESVVEGVELVTEET